MYAQEAIDKLLTEFQFETVLDVGCGEGLHVARFLAHGKTVTACDIAPRMPHRIASACRRVCSTPDEAIEDGETFDAVWCSHVLEHQHDAHTFLLKLRSALPRGGLLAITVPPLKHQIVGGHVSLWNSGLLLYRLVLAGFDCCDARLKCYGYNISVIVEKQAFTMPALAHDHGDIERLRDYFPPGAGISGDSFDGDIQELSW